MGQTGKFNYVTPEVVKAPVVEKPVEPPAPPPPPPPPPPAPVKKTWAEKKDAAADVEE